VDRTACVDLPAFPLQLLLRRHPDWRDAPAAVVDEDRPQGTILWVNERARARRVLPGMRYAAGLALATGLRAAVVPDADVDRAVAWLAQRLRRYTPHVEPAAGEPGIFWLDASGLEPLWPALKDWAGAARAELERAGFRVSLVVGFGRFGTYALARSGRGVVVLDRPASERAASRRVPLERLAFEPRVRDALARLGVATVGGFADLPVEGIARRFGPDALRLHRLASGELRVPVQSERPVSPAVGRMVLDHAETKVERLMVVVERLLGPLLETLARRAHAVAGLQLGFRFERLGDHVETIRPAEPTLDAKQLLDLVRLRLQVVRKLPDGVGEVVLVAAETAAGAEQMRLVGRPRRDLAAGNRALARVRAEFGDGAVVRARLREGHLPEARFFWEALDGLAEPRPRRAGAGRLVRRIHDRPVALPPRPRQEPDGWMLRGLEQGPVVRVVGPYVVSGGWWRRAVHREYHFAETQKGELLWVYYDRVRRRWFLQGRVE
jgi:protein ImuB